MFSTAKRATIITACLTLVSTFAAAQGGLTQPKQGQGGSVVQGAAGTEGGVGDNGLEHCDKPMGAMAVVEPQNEILTGASTRYNLQSPVGLIRMMIQQSNCFIVVERGVGMQNMMQERALAAAGEARAGIEHGRRPDGGGRLHPDAGGRVLREQRRRRRRRGRRPARAQAPRSARSPAASSSRKRRRACSSPTRAAACRWPRPRAAPRRPTSGSAPACSAAAAAAAGGGYGNTNEGKIIAAAFMDNYNNVVKVVRNDPSLQRNVGTLKQEAAAGGTTKAGAVFNEGDVLDAEDRQRQADGGRLGHQQGARDARQRRRARRHRRREGRLHQRAGGDRERLGEDRAGAEEIAGFFRNPVRRLQYRYGHDATLSTSVHRDDDRRRRCGDTRRRGAVRANGTVDGLHRPDAERRGRARGA